MLCAEVGPKRGWSAGEAAGEESVEMTAKVRSAVFVVVTASALMLFAGFAWLTHHPEVTWLEELAERPVVGPPVRWFRARYAPASVEPLGDVPPAKEDVAPERIAGEPVPVIRSEARPFVWTAAGDVLRGQPRRQAEAITTFAAPTRVTRLERRGDWYRVRWQAKEGWIHLPGYDEVSAPPLGNEPEPVRPVPAAAADPERLVGALSGLSTVRAVAAGPYPLYTDVADEALLARLDQVAAQLESHYERRYGRPLLGTAAETLVLFRERAAYEALKAGTGRLAGLPSEGHVSRGLVAFCRGGRSDAEVEGTLVHEVTHLLNRRGLGPALPPWLDEGIADEMAESERDASGRTDAGSLGGEAEKLDGGVVRLAGGFASLDVLFRARTEGRLLSVVDLVALDWQQFVHPGQSALHYAQSSFFIRFLLDGEGARRRSGFHAFLAAVSDGVPPDLATLAGHLGETTEQIELLFRVWLAVETRSERVSGTELVARSRRRDSAG